MGNGFVYKMSEPGLWTVGHYATVLATGTRAHGGKASIRTFLPVPHRLQEVDMRQHIQDETRGES